MSQAGAADERSLFLVRGGDGVLAGHYRGKRQQPLPQRLDGEVPPEVLARLATCERVEVLARPPLHGRIGLLPSKVAWNYLTRTSDRRAPPPGPAIHLVVSDVEIPPDVPLKRLNAWKARFGPQEQPVTLSGAEAMPSRVLRLLSVAGTRAGGAAAGEPGAGHLGGARRFAQRGSLRGARGLSRRPCDLLR